VKGKQLSALSGFSFCLRTIAMGWIAALLDAIVVLMLLDDPKENVPGPSRTIKCRIRTCTYYSAIAVALPLPFFVPVSSIQLHVEAMCSVTSPHWRRGKEPHDTYLLPILPIVSSFSMRGLYLAVYTLLVVDDTI
jgi:hypothetical protein